MRKKLIPILTAILTVSIPISAFANSRVVREYKFESHDKHPEYTKNKIIEIDGKKYEAVKTKVKYAGEKDSEIKKEFKDLTEKKAPEEIKEKGKTYILSKADYEDTSFESKKEYRGDKKPDFPETDVIDKDGKKYEAVLKDVKESVSTAYDTPFSVPGKFYGEEGIESYMLKGKRVPAVNAPSFSGYRAEVLNYLDLDPSIYRIDSGRWQGGYYTDANGETVRNAVFTGYRKGTIYTATYEARSYTANAVYTASGDNTYEFIAEVEYERQGFSTVAKVLIGAGLFILAVAISFFIAFMKKRKKNDD